MRRYESKSMNRNFLTLVGRVILAAVSIAITTSMFSPVVGQTAEDSSTQQILEQQPEDNQIAELPEPVANAVLQGVSQQMGIEISSLSVIEAQKQNWSNSCLELADECEDGMVSGWLVTVGKDNELFVYRTNESGSVVGMEQSITLTKPSAE
jgi:hypothetical protein